MDAMLSVLSSIGHAIEAALDYIESHHWVFELAAFGYIFYLHDRALHARFDALDKRTRSENGWRWNIERPCKRDATIAWRP